MIIRKLNTKTCSNDFFRVDDNLSRRRIIRLSENTNKLGVGQTNIEPFSPNPNPLNIEETLIIISNQLIQICYLATSLLSRQVDTFRIFLAI